jgi:hypothetical protein
LKKTSEIPQQQPLSVIKSTRRNLIIVLIGSIIVANSFIVLSSGEDRVFFSNWTINITAAIALGSALIIVYRQKLDGLYGKAFASLAVGLTLWFIAEIVWTYFELGLHIDSPFPSIADLFWLIGYSFLAYHLYRIYNFVRIGTIKPVVVVMVSVATAIILGFVVYLIISISELSNTQNQDPDDMVLLLVSIAYPILDGILLVPAVLVLWTARAGQLANTHWMLLALSLLIIVTADSGFAYIAVLDVNSLQRGSWLWDMFYNAGYLLIAAALFWHNKFFISNEKEIMKKWQEQNR